ncbi:MAG: glycosyltransferase family 39 protein, partial [Planctomycetota bacterium]
RGIPCNSVFDTHVVKGALGMAQDKDLAPPAGRYSTYPNLLPYVLLPVYGAEYAWGRATGEWGGAEEFGMQLKERPELAHLPARVTLAALAALSALFVFLTARAAGLARGAWIAAYLTATALLHVHLSVQERPWAPMCTFFALSAWPAALYARSGRTRHLVLSGVAAGLAFATHQAGGLSLGLAGAAWLFGPKGWSGRAALERVASGIAAVATFAVTGIVVGLPYLLLGLESENVVGDVEKIDGPWFEIGGLRFGFAFRLESTLKLGRAILGYDPVLVLSGLAGLGLALRSRATRALGAFAAFYLLFFITNQADHVRYLGPLTVLFAWPAALFLDRLWSRGPAPRAVVLVLLALPLAQALRLGWVMRQPDTRALAETALVDEYAAERVACDIHGALPPLTGPALERLAGQRALGGREEHRRLLLEAGVPHPDGPGVDAVMLEAIIDYDRRVGSSRVEAEDAVALSDDPNVALERLGVDLVLIVDTTPGDGRPALLLSDEPAQPDLRGRPQPKMPPLDVDPAPIATWSPSEGGSAVDDANLPSELTFPLTQIWRTSRPGPELSLHRFRRSDRGR